MKAIASYGRLARLFIVVFLLSTASLAQALTLGESRLPDFTKLVEENSAAVVNISTTQKVKHPMMPHGFQMPDIPEDSPRWKNSKPSRWVRVLSSIRMVML